MKKYLRIFGFILAIMFGVFMFIYGGYDDSPGAQLLGVVIFGFGAIWLIKINKHKTLYQYYRKQFFLSKAEHECYDALITAVGQNYYIFAQVHLPTIIQHTLRGQNWQGALSHINRKSVDFVLCDKSYISPQLAIELDDQTHEKIDRKERDFEVERILKQVGLPLLRLENRGRFNPLELAKKINNLL